ncbi:MAG: hypothetical protein JJU25_15635, partial [Halomonas sp.]
TYHSFHRLQRCASPAADAYFTVFIRSLQEPFVKKFHARDEAVTKRWQSSYPQAPDGGRLWIETIAQRRQRPYKAGAVTFA